ncbi:cation transporting ATPase C-terminal domain-containing protein [Lacticaseibacillus camelliae]|uniref:cation transporting ATPase C-terminal domain-containing protein n=1 Tax=Lacticaseibacillus camelliae TaxID=381742 RepID=UPI000A858FE9
MKSVHQSLFTVGFFRNRTFNWAILLSGLLLAVTILVPGFNGLFHVTELDGFQWATVLGAGVAMIVIVEVVKFCQRHLKKG